MAAIKTQNRITGYVRVPLPITPEFRQSRWCKIWMMKTGGIDGLSDGMSARAIARILGCSFNTVNARWDDLQASLGRYGIIAMTKAAMEYGVIPLPAVGGTPKTLKSEYDKGPDNWSRELVRMVNYKDPVFLRLQSPRERPKVAITA